MLSLKFIVSALFCLRLFSEVLLAQRQYGVPVHCNDFCDTDTSLFFTEIKPVYSISENAWRNTNLYGSYFNLFPQVRSDIISALSFYPELVNARIKFSYKPIRQTMNSRPSPSNIFRKKANRRYSIIVNNNKGKIKGLPFERLSFNIKTGWLGHELAHICDYEKMNTWQTFCFALKYVFLKKYVSKVERYTDLVTIQHGLAFPLYDGTDYLLRSNEISGKYKKYAITNGLSLQEIMCLWCKSRTEEIQISVGNSVGNVH